MAVTADPIARRWALVATISASATAFVDGSVVQITLPALQRDFGADFATLQWVVSIYNLVLGAMVMVGGAVGDSLGRRAVFVTGTGLFVAASLACGVAPTVGLLIAARGAQGIGAALMVPQSLAIIAATFPEAIRGRAIGTWAAASALTTAIGPPLGGFLIDAVSWRAAFLVNLPIGLFALWATFRHVGESRAVPAKPVDWGAGLIAIVGLGGLTAALTYLPLKGLSDPLVIGGLAAALIGIGAFLVWEARVKDPMVPLSLFRNRTFALVNLLTVLLYGALSGALFVLPYTLIDLDRYTATEAGTAMLPLALAIGFLSRAFGTVGDRFGPRPPLVVGATIVAAATAWLAVTRTDGGYFVGVFGPLLGIGLGMSIVISPLTTAVMNSVGDALSGTASGINNAAARVAGLLAVVITGALAVAAFRPELTVLVAGNGLDAATGAKLIAQSDRLLEMPTLADLSGPVRTSAQAAVNEAYRHAFVVAVAVNAALAALAAAVGLMLPRHPRPATYPGDQQPSQDRRVHS